MEFKKALMEAAKAALETDDITRADFVRVWMLCHLPLPGRGSVLRQVEAAAAGSLAEMGVVAGPAEAIDWETFIKQLIEILPAIISLILLLL